MVRDFKALLMGIAMIVFSVNAFAGSSAYKSSSFGYAAGATGGGSATPTLVTTASELETALKASGSKVIIITKDITVTNHISVVATNKTLMAVKGVKLISNQQNSSSSGILYFKSGSSNIILRNLTFVGPGAYDCDGWDNLCFDGVTKAWVDHCDFQDGCDGNFDNKGKTDNITVSWCRFRYLKTPKAGGSGGTDDHRFSNLLGSSSTDKPSDGKYSMTWAYCWWDEGCVERMLRCRNAELHFLNCAWTSSVAHYYVGPQNACALFDGCYFGVPTKPVSGKNYIFYQNYGGTNGCKFNSCSGNSSYMTNSGSVTTPSYSYSTLSASTAKSELASYAGATLNVTTAGAVSESGSSTSTSSSSSSSSSTSTSTASTTASYTVVTAGSASSLLSAISTANSKASSSARAYIFVPNGTYDLGTAYNTKVSSYVSIIGESRDGVIIKNTPSTEGLGTTATLYTTGNNIYMQDITLQCRASYNSSTKAERSVAWWDHGTKNMMKNVCLDGTQDTYWSNGSEGMLAYFEGGYIKGTTDFICGSGSVFFNSVNIYCQNSSVKTSGDVITAPSTYASEKGYVFHYCSINGTSSQAGTYNLGRPWQNSPASAWLNTKFAILPSSNGWTTMNSGLALRFHEYNNTYNGSAITSHSISALGGSSSSESLYLSSTSGYALTDVLGSWGSTAYSSCAQLTAPTPSLSGTKLSWSAVSGAKAYLIEKDGKYVAITTSTSYTVSSTGSYTVRVANAMGGFGTASTAVSYTGSSTSSSSSTTTTTTTSASGYKTISSQYIFTDFTASGLAASWITNNNVSSFTTSGTVGYINPSTEAVGSTSSKTACSAAQVKNTRTLSFNVTNCHYVVVYAFHTNSSASRNLVITDGTKSKTTAVTAGGAVSSTFYPSTSGNTTITVSTDETSGVMVYAIKFVPKTSTASATTWDFSTFSSTITLTGSNYNYSYNGLTLVGNTSSTYTNDFVNANGFHCNGASSSSIRYIKYTPSSNGTLTVYFKSNNTSDNARTSAIGTAVGTPVATATCATGQVSASVTSGKTYYAYFVSGGQTITKIVFTPSSSSAKSSSAFDDETTAIEKIDCQSCDNASIYTLSGRKLSDNSALAPGIYIKNGKKFIVR